MACDGEDGGLQGPGRDHEYTLQINSNLLTPANRNLSGRIPNEELLAIHARDQSQSNLAGLAFNIERPEFNLTSLIQLVDQQPLPLRGGPDVEEEQSILLVQIRQNDEVIIFTANSGQVTITNLSFLSPNLPASAVFGVFQLSGTMVSSKPDEEPDPVSFQARITINR
jgi:hypothetical protein